MAANLGILYGIAAALAFSIAAVFYKKGFTGKQPDILFASGLRAFPTFLLLLLVNLVLKEDIGVVFNENVMLFAFLSLFTALVIGDTFFFLALKITPLSIVYPISYSFSLFASIFSFIFLNESITVFLMLSILVLVLGIFLVYSDREKGKVKLEARGIFYSFITAVFWGLSVIFTKIGLNYATPLILNLTRISMLTLIALPYLAYKRDQIKGYRKGLGYIVIGGFLGIGIGPVLFFFSIINIGASRASILASGAPLLSLIMASIFLREKIKRKQLIGILLVILSVYLVYLS